MSLKLPNVGELNVLDILRAAFNAGGLLMGLFQNNLTPGDTTVLGDITEATFSGYARQALAGFGAATTVSGRASTTGSACSWTRGAGGTSNSIYGYYVLDSTGTKLLWIERDPNGPVSMTAVGTIYTVFPVFTLATEF